MAKFRTRNSRAATLTAAQVVDILTRFAEGMTQGELSRMFHISIGQIGRITRREAWQDIDHVPARVAPPSKEEIEASAARFLAKMAGQPPEDKVDAVETFQAAARAKRAPQEPTGEGLDRLRREAASEELDELMGLNQQETKDDNVS